MKHQVMIRSGSFILTQNYIGVTEKITPEDVKFSVEYYANKIPYAG